MTRSTARGARVLVVDESAAVGQFLCGLLESGNRPAADLGSSGSCSSDSCSSDSATNDPAPLPVEAAHAARRCDVHAALLHDQVDVVVVSHSGAGIAATTALVRELRGRPEPRLRGARLLTLVDEETDARFGLADSADAVLVRPVDATEFRRQVQALALGRSR